MPGRGPVQCGRPRDRQCAQLGRALENLSRVDRVRWPCHRWSTNRLPLPSKRGRLPSGTLAHLDLQAQPQLQFFGHAVGLVQPVFDFDDS